MLLGQTKSQVFPPNLVRLLRLDFKLLINLLLTWIVSAPRLLTALWPPLGQAVHRPPRVWHQVSWHRDVRPAPLTQQAVWSSVDRVPVAECLAPGHLVTQGGAGHQGPRPIAGHAAPLGGVVLVQAVLQLVTLWTQDIVLSWWSDDPLTCLRPPAVVAALHPLVQIPVVVHQHVIVVNKPGHVLRGEDAVVPSDAGHPAVTEMKTVVKNILITRRTLTGTRKSCRCCPSGTPGSSPSLTRS